MKLINCKKCGVLFRKSLRDICDRCQQEEQKKIVLICEYAKGRSGAKFTLEELSQSVGISLDEIQHFHKKRRLHEIEHLIIMKCKICSSEIGNLGPKGYFCNKCIESMRNDEIVTGPEKKTSKLQPGNKSKKTEQEKHVPEPTRYGFKKNFD